MTGQGAMLRPGRGLAALLAAAPVLWLVVGEWPGWLTAFLISKKAFLSAVLNGITLGGLYFLVASGFTVVFGLMRNVNLSHGSLCLLGAYLGFEGMEATGSRVAGMVFGTVALAAVGALMQVAVFRRLEGDDLRQTLVTIGIEHDLDVALRVAGRVSVMQGRRLFRDGTPAEIEADPEVQRLYLGGQHG